MIQAPASVQRIATWRAALLRPWRWIAAVLHQGSPVQMLPEEMDALDQQRASLVAARPIPRGTRITPAMLTLKAPARGVSSNLLPVVEGREALYDIAQDEPITFGLVDIR